ncbi:hypothetical protein GCM10017557_05320 [Streptomyces aurantiacus]|uniref:Uncharacterized protein n=1 Tax=Streptomyces aurantiacus TaxID=47760 RepID=A0A7G1NQY9_9ACTN|nr:hypothetical protein GCM10017557_05320 [Streptomyces aurantiacus]
MPGGAAAGAAEGAAGGLNAVAGITVAAVSPAASAVVPVAVTTKRRVGRASGGRGAGGEVCEASGARCCPLGSSVLFLLGRLASGVLMSCVLIAIMLGARPTRNQDIHTDEELKPLDPS